MNYIAGMILFHTSNIHIVNMILKFLFCKFKMEFVYCFKTMPVFIETISKLLKTSTPKLLKLTLKFKFINLKLLLIDWLFTLGC